MASETPFDVVIHGGTLLTVNPGFDIIPDGILCIRNSAIARITDRHACPILPAAAAVVDAAGSIVMPGLVNTHTHLPMTLFRGLADDLPLM